jgi:hypothetical protein
MNLVRLTLNALGTEVVPLIPARDSVEMTLVIPHADLCLLAKTHDPLELDNQTHDREQNAGDLRNEELLL